ncbi:hypothetical protein BVRB_021810, partial [Beta vulgaris subsp. vulgaris]
ESHAIEDSISKRLTNLQKILKNNQSLTPDNIGDLIVDNTESYRRQLETEDERAARNLEEERHRIDAMLNNDVQEDNSVMDVDNHSDDDVVEIIPPPSRRTAPAKRKASDVLNSQVQRPRTTANRSRARSRV